jgi:hypothetical protein
VSPALLPDLNLVELAAELDLASTPLVKQVFPTLDVIGWYTVGNEPTVTHSKLQAQVRPPEYPVSNWLTRLICRSRNPQRPVPLRRRITSPSPPLTRPSQCRQHVPQPPAEDIRIGARFGRTWREHGRRRGWEAGRVGLQHQYRGG